MLMFHGTGYNAGRTQWMPTMEYCEVKLGSMGEGVR